METPGAALARNGTSEPVNWNSRLRLPPRLCPVNSETVLSTNVLPTRSSKWSMALHRLRPRMRSVGKWWISPLGITIPPWWLCTPTSVAESVFRKPRWYWRTRVP